MLQVKYYMFAGVAELADASDLKSGGNLFPCRFEPDPRHHFFLYIITDIDQKNLKC